MMYSYEDDDGRQQTFRWQSSALLALQEATEAFLVHLCVGARGAVADALQLRGQQSVRTSRWRL